MYYFLKGHIYHAFVNYGINGVDPVCIHTYFRPQQPIRGQGLHQTLQMLRQNRANLLTNCSVCLVHSLLSQFFRERLASSYRTSEKEMKLFRETSVTMVWGEIKGAIGGCLRSHGYCHKWPPLGGLSQPSVFSQSPGGQKPDQVVGRATRPLKTPGRLLPAVSSTCWLLEPLACGSITPSSASFLPLRPCRSPISLSQLGHRPLDLRPNHNQQALILAWLQLQRPSFPIRPPSQGPGLDLNVSVLGHDSSHRVVGSGHWWEIG